MDSDTAERVQPTSRTFYVSPLAHLQMAIIAGLLMILSPVLALIGIAFVMGGGGYTFGGIVLIIIALGLPVFAWTEFRRSKRIIRDRRLGHIIINDDGVYFRTYDLLVPWEQIASLELGRYRHVARLFVGLRNPENYIDPVNRRVSGKLWVPLHGLKSTPLELLTAIQSHPRCRTSVPS